ncbi:MAG: PQQ-dependent sugar dehydrogenase [Roseicyclus sp.]
MSALALAAALLAAPSLAQPVDDGPPNRPGIAPAFPEQTDAPERVSDFVAAPERIAGGLEHPWAVAVLPDGAGYLVTERPGRLRHITRDGTVSAPIPGVPEVFDMAQGGLLDVALAPDFADSRMLYLSFSKPLGLGRSATAVIRARLLADHPALEDVTEIFEQTPPSRIPIHYGSRVVPDPDGTVWITTGERGGTAATRARAQDVSATYGAVVRVTQDGAPAPDNPFAGEGAAALRYTLGQRNIQGAALEPATGALWTIEHGPAGGDELNLIEPGANYGWPRVSYGTNYNGSEIGDGRAAHAPDFAPPVYYWDPVIAPGGMAFYHVAQGDEMFPEWVGDLFVAGLVAQSVVRLSLADGRVVEEERLARGIGRVRDVAIDTSGAILFVTDAGDGGLYRLARR